MPGRGNIRYFLMSFLTLKVHFSISRQFVFWTLPQIQYKNPNTQVLTLKNLTPSPFITCFLGITLEIYYF